MPSARFMGGREHEMLQVSEISSEQTMHKLLNNVTSPLMLMPSVVPGTGPYPNAENKWIGGDASNDKSLHDCAVTLYLALMTHECMQLIGSDGATYIEGPLAHDQNYARMLTAVSNRPVYVSASQTGTSVGAAMLINAPDTLPEYTLVKLDSTMRDKLRAYATNWQAQLLRHSR